MWHPGPCREHLGIGTGCHFVFERGELADPFGGFHYLAGSIIYQVVIAVLAIIAIVSLITVGIKMYSGDQESAQKALGWCGGMVFCIIAALVLKNFIGL